MGHQKYHLVQLVDEMPLATNPMNIVENINSCMVLPFDLCVLFLLISIILCVDNF